MASGKSKSKPASAERDATLQKLLGKLTEGRVCTVGELFREASVPLARSTVQALAREASVLARNVSVLGEGDLSALHVCARGSIAQAAERDDVLLGLIQRRASMGSARAYTLAQLSDMVAPHDKSVLGAALTTRAKAKKWPEGVGALPWLKTTLVFMMSAADP